MGDQGCGMGDLRTGAFCCDSGHSWPLGRAQAGWELGPHVEGCTWLSLDDI